MPISIIQQDKITLLLPKINKHLSGLLKNDWFEISFWKKQNAVTGQSVGRGITWFVGHQDDEWVLRHYNRGGLVEKLLKDKYVFSKIKNTRCYQELLLLERMYSQGLSVPKPIAARIIKQGLFYQADLLTEKIPHSQDLVHKLQVNALTESDWHAMGAMIGKFHEAGIYHADLNSHNILIDQDHGFWLIDFDKCAHRNTETSWQRANLDRLRRSFTKEKALHTTFYFDEQNWVWLMQGYQSFYHQAPKTRA